MKITKIRIPVPYYPYWDAKLEGEFNKKEVKELLKEFFSKIVEFNNEI